MTPKQKVYGKYMLMKIGMNNPEQIDLYLEHLVKLYGKFKRFYRNNSYYKGYDYFYTLDDLFNLLQDEINLKQKKFEIKLLSKSDNIAATDLANFNYCPAAYSINKSFVIENPSDSEAMEIGINFHEQLRLIPCECEKHIEIEEDIYDDVIKKIRNSKLIFHGHQEKTKVFVNGKFVGTPDYIFQDLSGQFFVVEEKFHKKKDPEYAYYDYDENNPDEYLETKQHAVKKWKNQQVHFYENHIIQVLSYIKNIIEYPISYGYLIYWHYDINNSNEIPYIHKVAVKKVLLDKENENFFNVIVNSIEEIIKNNKIEFSPSKLNMKKCAGCVVNKYCSHKTGKYNILTLPYDINLLKIYAIKFPDELKKTDSKSI